METCLTVSKHVNPTNMMSTTPSSATHRAENRPHETHNDIATQTTTRPIQLNQSTILLEDGNDEPPPYYPFDEPVEGKWLHIKPGVARSHMLGYT